MSVVVLVVIVILIFWWPEIGLLGGLSGYMLEDPTKFGFERLGDDCAGT